jgi:hypothetical protein
MDSDLRGSLLEFFATPEFRWEIYNHSREPGIDGTKIAPSPSSLSYRGSAVVHVFAAGVDGSLLEFYATPGPRWEVLNHSRDSGIAGTLIGSSPFALAGRDDSIHLFAAGTDGSLLEFHAAAGKPWTVHNRTQDAGTGAPKIAGSPFALLDPDGCVHVFAAGTEGSLLEFYAAPGSAGEVFNRSRGPGIKDTKIAGSPFALMGKGNSVHIFAAGTDGSLLEFHAAAGIPWTVHNHSRDVGTGASKIAGSPFALMDLEGCVHVFARGIDDSLLEFYAAPGANWEVFDRARDLGINGIRIAGSPFALTGESDSVRVFAASTDGSLLEFHSGAGIPWVIQNHSREAGPGGPRIAGRPSALRGAGNNVHVFAAHA